MFLKTFANCGGFLCDGCKYFLGSLLDKARVSSLIRTFCRDACDLYIYFYCLTFTSVVSYDRRLIFIDCYKAIPTAFVIAFLDPEMYVNGDEVMSTVLIDDDLDTCMTLNGSYGCGMDKVWPLVTCRSKPFLQCCSSYMNMSIWCLGSMLDCSCFDILQSADFNPAN